MLRVHSYSYTRAYLHIHAYICVTYAYHSSRRTQFGEAIALYFLFLLTYTKFLTAISLLGVLFYIFGNPYSTLYSTLLLVWRVLTNLRTGNLDRRR